MYQLPAADINTDRTDNDMNELEYECLQHLINELNTNNPMNECCRICFFR